MTNRSKYDFAFIFFTYTVIGKIRLEFRNSIIFHEQKEVEIDFNTCSEIDNM